jgi:CHASE3 domain sensor protein
MDTECAIERVFAAIKKKPVASLDNDSIENAKTEVAILRGKELDTNARETFETVAEIIQNVAGKQSKSAATKCTKKIKEDFDQLLKKYLVKVSIYFS